MFAPGCLPVLIGSLPTSSHQEALSLVLQATPELPLWPQLPRNPKEGMVRQFLCGLPGLKEEGNKYWIDSSDESLPEAMAAFYEEYLAVQSGERPLATSRFALNKETAAGFFALLALLEYGQAQVAGVKGQVTGPVTTGIGLKDSQGRPVIYDEALRDVLVKHLAMKASYQVEQLQGYGRDWPPLIFIDEPGLVSFGSSGFSGISQEMVTACVAEVTTAIRRTGGWAGVHICANGDWGPVFDSDIDVISFDAYSYFDNITLFRPQLTGFLQRGGVLAWGIIPTGDPLAVEAASADQLYHMWREQLEILKSFGFTGQQLMAQTLIAPACGTGSLPLPLAQKVLQLTRQLSQTIRARDWRYYSGG